MRIRPPDKEYSESVHSAYLSSCMHGLGERKSGYPVSNRTNRFQCGLPLAGYYVAVFSCVNLIISFNPEVNKDTFLEKEEKGKKPLCGCGCGPFETI